MKMIQYFYVVLMLITLCACDSSDTPNSANTEMVSAAVTGVTVAGEPGNYTLSVTITSPDTGCEQYADWWEVFRPDGTLLYRRVLLHSHVDEQPFTRSGGPVTVLDDEEIIIRVHMNNLGYSPQVFRGNVDQGLTADSLDNELSPELAMTEPLPNGCAF